MRIGLFIPCFIDAFFPEVGIATLELLERFGHEVVYPRDQTCCGQPMADNGFNAEAAGTEALFVRNFSGLDYVVAPEGSCVHHVRDNFDAVEPTAAVTEVRARTYELVEFLHDIEKADAFPWAKFPHRVGLHNKCIALRRLKHAKPSEVHEPFFSKPMDLLSKVEEIAFVQPTRPDECCGFGGTFSVFEEVVSTKMGYDKVRDHAQAGAEYIVSADSSCRVVPRSTATGRSTRQRPPRASSPLPSTRKCMTSGSGTCGRSATVRCAAFPNGRSFGRSLRRSRSTRSPISTSISTSSRPMRDRMGSTCIGQATVPSTTSSCTAFCATTARSC